jgi:hypothetical protein
MNAFTHSREIPEDHGPVGDAGGKHDAVGTEGHAGDRVAMASDGHTKPAERGSQVRLAPVAQVRKDPVRSAR